MTDITVYDSSRMVHYHPPVGLSTLFRLLPKLKDGARPPLDVTYQLPHGGPELKFSARAALGMGEQTLLLVLLELAREQFEALRTDVVVSEASESKMGVALWGRLNSNDTTATGQTLRLETTWYQLNGRVGRRPGGTNDAIRKQELSRLCEVIVWETIPDAKNSKRQSYLVVWLAGDDDRIHIALNCRLASALLGQQYVQVSLSERLRLKHDPSRAVHAFLSTTVCHGANLKIGLEKLVERFWPGSLETAKSGTHSGRRDMVKNALKDIGRLKGWTVEWERSDLAFVLRLTLAGAEKPRRNDKKSMSYRQTPMSIKNNKINGLEAFDVSGLFFTKG
jgi:hypothetical protein